MSTHRSINPNEGLIFVYSEPGSNVPEKEFNDWYNNEHVPPRLTVSGILTSSRYKAIDSKTPSWVALYHVTSPDVAQTTEYKALRANASDKENELIAKLGLLNRRVYSHVLTDLHPRADVSLLPGRYLLIVHMQVTPDGEEEFNKWYNEEHMILVSKVPGWIRGSRYKLVESVYRGREIQEASAKQPRERHADYLAIHEWDRDDFKSLPEFTYAINTPWREKIMETVIGKELRVFEQHKVFKRAEPVI